MQNYLPGARRRTRRTRRFASALEHPLNWYGQQPGEHLRPDRRVFVLPHIRSRLHVLLQQIGDVFRQRGAVAHELHLHCGGEHRLAFYFGDRTEPAILRAEPFATPTWAEAEVDC